MKTINMESRLKNDKIYNWLSTYHNQSELVEYMMAIREAELKDSRVEELLIKERRSIKLEKEDVKTLKKYIGGFYKKAECIRDCKVDYQVVDLAIKRGSCSEKTLVLLKEVITLLTN